MEQLKMNDEEFKDIYHKYHNEYDAFDYSILGIGDSYYENDFESIFSIGRESNINAVVNSLHDTIEYFIVSKIYMEYAYRTAEQVEISQDEAGFDYYWLFYYQNITLNHLHTLHDLLYNLVYEEFGLYEIKRDFGFRKNIVNTLRQNEDERARGFGSILNKDSPVRTTKYRDEYTHNIKPYRLKYDITKDGNATWGSLSTKKDYEPGQVNEDIDSDIKKLSKKARKLKTAILEYRKYKNNKNWWVIIVLVIFIISASLHISF